MSYEPNPNILTAARNMFALLDAISQQDGGMKIILACGLSVQGIIDLWRQAKAAIAYEEDRAEIRTGRIG